MSATQNRNTMLDAMRGIAALAVVVTHIQAKFIDTSDRITFDFGGFGVTLFFLCSGYIIPVSISRSASLRVFWIRRFFRLYPLYWFSIGCWLMVVYVFHLGMFPSQLMKSHPLEMVIVNITMLQSFLGVDNLVPVYWTLGVEMLFYCITSLLVFFNVKIKPVIGILFCLLISLYFDVFMNISILQKSAFMYMAIIFTGYIFYIHQTTKDNAGLYRNLLLVVISQSAYILFVNDNAISIRISFLIAYMCSIICFLAFIYNHRIMIPHFFVKLGVWSYSLYLLHLLVLTLVPPLINPLVSLVVWVSLSIGLAALSYQLIELPMMRLGKKYTPHQEPIARPAPTEG